MAFFLIFLIIGLVVAILRLTSGKTNSKSESVVIRSKKSPADVAGIIRQAAYEMKANVDKIADDPLGGAQDDIAVVLSGEEKGLSRDVWAVQVYVQKSDSGSDIELVALGEGLSAGYSRGYTGPVYTGRINMKSSRTRRDILASKLGG